MEVKSLFDLASFNVAKYVWNCYVDENRSVWSKTRDLRHNSEAAKPNSYDLDRSYLSKLYPCLPLRLQKSILHAAIFIEKELSRWKNSVYDIVGDFNHISWTPSFTIDKIKSFCRTKKFDISSKTLCECCFNAYVDDSWSSLSPGERNSLRRFFGNFVEHVILYWHWYGRQNRSLMTHVHKYNVHYENGEPLENVFKLCVFIEYETAVFYYWEIMNSDRRAYYPSLVVQLLLFESDHLDYVESNGLLPIYTLSFFWNKLVYCERLEIVQACFLDFYRYMLYHETGISIIHALLDKWSPEVSPLEYYKLLRLANDTDNLDLFELLWKRKLTALSFEAIGHLMWTLLLHRDTDFKLSVMMINDFDPEQKVEVLNELDKRIECVHFNFNDRIDGFLKAASLEHLRVIGFPRNPKPRRDRGRRRGPSRRFHRAR